MNIRRRMMLAAFVGGWLTQVGTAAEPPRFGLASNTPLPAVSDSTNQQLAETIASHLRQSGQLRGYAVEIVVVGGSVELTGNVSSQPQRDEVLRLVQGVPGVERVVDHLRPVDSLTRVQATQPGLPTGPNLPGSLPAPAVETGPAPDPVQPPSTGGIGTLPQVGPGTVPTPLPPPVVGGNFPPPQMGGIPGVAMPGQGRPEPMPVWQLPGGGGGYSSMNPPRMPPYSWPTYAPYNNYSRVAYPEAYPANAWPFIGPIHPFPKVPLGWRSVKLEWDDGYWWFSRTATKHDWWRLRFY